MAWVVIDHIKGQRRGQRQELELSDRITIGRHPKCEISFDTTRDLEASTRHAELRYDGRSLSLVDVGSSNGTYVNRNRINQAEIVAGRAAEVEFGKAGPRLRIWWHPEADPSEGPPIPARRSFALLIVAIALLVAIASFALVRAL